MNAERARLLSWAAGRAAYERGSKYEHLAAFRALMDEKLTLGDEKYGTDSWSRHDMLAEAMAEMVDLGNYAYLKWLQLKALQDALDEGGVPRSLSGEDRLGVQSAPPPVMTNAIAGPTTATPRGVRR
jgi:hypothetical protein